MKKAHIKPGKNDCLDPRALNHYYDKDRCDVSRDIITVEEAFQDKDGNLPSGKNVDNLVDYI